MSAPAGRDGLFSQLDTDSPVEADFLWPHLQELPYFRALIRSVEAHFYQGIPLPAPTLDIGCGDGHFASLAFQQKLAVGLDPSLSPLQEAFRRDVYEVLVQGEGGQMPFPDGFFSSAVSNSVLEHIPDVQAVLREIGRVLRPGAPFVFCVPNPGYLSELSIPALLDRVGLPRLGRAYTDWFRTISRVHHADAPEVWEARLLEAGLRVERWWHYFPPAAMRSLEWGHYLGAPTLPARWITGRWILAPTRWNLALTERLVRRHARPDPDPQGTFTFFVTRKHPRLETEPSQGK